MGHGWYWEDNHREKVYNHIETKRCFECFAWVCITQQCQIRSVLEEVLKQLISHKREDITKLSTTELIQQLSEIQKAKRCMVVLDDIWEIDHWAGLKHAFLFEGSSSKVLLTTRKQNIAAVGFPFELELLNIDDGSSTSVPLSLWLGWHGIWLVGFVCLVFSLLYWSRIFYFPFEEKWLQKVGKEMVCKCGYLPLVISLLGGILSKRKSLKEWETVNQNINAYLYKGDEIEKENEIHAVLNLSYEDLPYYLKPCFLYMGQFREDDTILVNTLYRLWIAQGMILHEHQENDDDTLMDVAELYLSELASRCIVQVEVENVIRETKYRSFKLHDVVRDMCLSKGTKEGFCCHVINPDRNRPITSLLLGTKSLRHLAVDFGSEMEIRRDDDQLRITTSHDQDTGKHVRSLQFLNDLRGKTIEFPENVVDFHEFKVLRVLVFQNFNFSGRKLPRGFGNLIHLRYLRFQNCAIDELPSSIANFRYLHTLSLRGCWNVRVPNILKKMIRLKHLLLPSYNTRLAGNYRLRLEGLDELETLSGFNSLVHDLKSVTRMKNLRRIRATVHDKQSLWTIIDAISTHWKNLRSCALLIANGCQFTSTEEGVMILERVFAYPHLYDLRINVKIGNLLEECENQVIISKIRTLFLFDCRIERDPMEILGKLLFIEELRIKGSFLGEEMKCLELGFPRLTYLTVEGLPNLKEWKIEKGAMPVIRTIEIDCCLHLEMLPDGLRFIDTLTKLVILRMPELGKRVSNDNGGGEDFDKVRHVSSITIIGNEWQPPPGTSIAGEELITPFMA
ncbi:hypothetical protein DH2020_005139 [Rehmannia glutinosa]|uniref:NB-ARC domain-containing protein n=1 Tax=Rehmannia glutinosa TaxID=99300 RepID=A0ABR0XRQ5_REHGL